MPNRLPTLSIWGPLQNAVVGTAPFPIVGLVTAPGMPEPVGIDSVIVTVDSQPPVHATLTVTSPPGSPVLTVLFSTTGQISGPDPHHVTVAVESDVPITVTGTVTVTVGPRLIAPSLWADLTFLSSTDASSAAQALQQNLLPTMAQRMANMSIVNDVLAMNWMVVGPNVVAVPGTSILRIGFWIVEADFAPPDLIQPTTDFPMYQMTPNAAAGCFLLVPLQPSPVEKVDPSLAGLFGFALSVPTATLQLIANALLPSIQSEAERHHATVDSITVQTGAANSLVAQVSGSYFTIGLSGTVTETLGIQQRPGTVSNMPAVLTSSVSSALAEIVSSIFGEDLAGKVKSTLNGVLQELPAWIPFRSSFLPDPSLSTTLFPFPMGVLNFDSFGTNDSGIIGTGSGSLANRVQSMVAVSLSGPNLISDYLLGNEVNYKVLLTAFEPDNDQMTWQFSDLAGAGTNTVNTDPFSQGGDFSTAFPIPSSVREYSFTLSVNGTETCATDPTQTLEGSASLGVTVTQSIQQG